MLLPVWRYAIERTMGLSHVVYGTSSPVEARSLSPFSCSRRRSKLLTWCTAVVAGVGAMGKVSKALWLIHFDDESRVFRLRHRLSLRLSSPVTRVRVNRGYSVVCSPVNFSGSRCSSRLEEVMVHDNT